MTIRSEYSIYNDSFLKDMSLIMPPIKNISEVTEPLKEEILKGDVHTIDEMKGMAAAFGLQQY